MSRIIFWRAEGCYASALSILEKMEDRVGQTPIFIRKIKNSLVEIKNNDVIINWGNGGYASWDDLKNTKKNIKILNQPEAVGVAANKIKTFKALNKDKVNTLDWTTDITVAKAWLNKGKDVISRAVVSGCCGEGITIHLAKDGTDKLPTVPLYTLYQKKRHEYRVHVFNGKAIDVVQKKRKNGADNKTNGMVRNIDDGWVFAHNDLIIKDKKRLNQIGVDAVKACGLLFGSVDIIWNESQDKYYVVEVNTAPGLESSTIDRFAENFLTYLKGNGAL